MGKFLKSFAMAFFIGSCVSGFLGCNFDNKNTNSSNTVLSENLLNEEFSFLGDAEWDYWSNINLTGMILPVFEYSEILLEVENWQNYEHQKEARIEFYYANWAHHYHFKNIELSGKINQTSWADYSFEFHTSEYLTGTIKITLTSTEAKTLAKEGLIINGYGITLKSLKVSTDEYKLDKSKSLEEQYFDGTNKRNKMIDYYSSSKELPLIYITTKNEEDVVLKEYYDSIVDVINCDSEYKLPEDIANRKAGVKVRGNSTAWGDEKPYRIKFEKKNSMLGLHNGKKYKSWVLLKTGWSIACDYLGFNLAHEIYETSAFNYYASDATYVHVIINGKYKGLYLLCEQNQTGSGRVDVYEPEKNDTSTKIGYMIELDNYAWEDTQNGAGRWFGENCYQGKEDYHFSLDYKYENKVPELTDINGLTREIPSDDFTLKNDIYSDEQVKFIHKYLKDVWDISYAAIEKGIYYKFDENYDLIPAPEYKTAKQACEAVIDLESLANEMILEELVRDNDVGAGSLYMAVDFTKAEGKKYNKLTFECPWDFNWAYSTYSQDETWFPKGKQYFAGAWQPSYVMEDWYEGRSNAWFTLFNKTEWFRKIQRERWETITPESLCEKIDEVEKDLEVPLKEANVSQSTTNFVRNRIEYIDKNLWK